MERDPAAERIVDFANLHRPQRRPLHPNEQPAPLLPALGPYRDLIGDINSDSAHAMHSMAGDSIRVPSEDLDT